MHALWRKFGPLLPRGEGDLSRGVRKYDVTDVS